MISQESAMNMTGQQTVVVQFTSPAISMQPPCRLGFPGQPLTEIRGAMEIMASTRRARFYPTSPLRQLLPVLIMALPVKTPPTPIPG